MSDDNLTTRETGIDAWLDEFQRRRQVGEDVRVTVYYRSYSPPAGGHSRRGHLYEKLQAVEGEEVIDDVEVTILGEQICLCQRCQRSQRDWRHRDTVTALASWTDGRLSSCGFAKREVRSTITDEQYRTVVPPELSIGVFVDEALIGVFPCQNEDQYFGADEFISRLSEETRGVAPSEDRQAEEVID